MGEIVIEHMQNLELPLFSTIDTEYNAPSPSNDAITIKAQAIPLIKPLENALQCIFPQSGEENTIHKTR